jgi:vacuolar-type H+-ATPase subunit E/Vma4
MAYYNEDQLKRYFESAMRDEAQQKIDALKDEIHKIYQREMTKVKDELHVKHMLERSRALREVNVVFQEKMNHIGIEYDAELIRERNHMADVVFEAIKNKLIEFTTTKAYSKLMAKKIHRIITQFPEHSFIFFIQPKDAQLRDVIQELVTQTYSIQTSTSIELGGFLLDVVESKAEFDETFDTILNEQRKQFRQSSKLFIR